MSARRSRRVRSAWPLPPSLLRYGLAVLSAGLAVLLMLGLRLVGAEDARPALLVAVALSALYGGLGPGLLALALVALVGRDPVFPVAGALLAAVCAVFRRPPTRQQLTREPDEEEVETVPTPKSDRFNRLDIPPARFSDRGR